MAGDDDFQLWLGRISNDRPLRHQLRIAGNRAGRKLGGGGERRFTGVRIGRGAGVGRVLSTRDRSPGFRARRVIVKARIVKLGGKGMGAARAHLRYLQRDGVTREGERGALYGTDHDIADGRAFHERQAGDRHQFRFIVSPEDGAAYDDLKSLTRRLMMQIEHDLGTKLDWVAVDHFNTGHPHTHIIVRGKDERGKDLVIARDYLSHGLRERAAELVNLDLGPRTDAEIDAACRNEIDQHRFTGIDRRLLRSIDEDGLVRAVHRDPAEQSLRAGRLRALAQLGLASEERPGSWTLDSNLEPILCRMGEQGDIIRTMQRAMSDGHLARSPADYAIHDPREGDAPPLVGRVVERGIADEHADRHYLIVDATDGRLHYVGIGSDAEAIPDNGIVRITGRPVAARGVDRTVAAVAAANDGRYDVDAHLRHDPTATAAFAERHLRRLEAIRRATGGVTREPDGTWVIAPDHLERAEAYERSVADRSPVIIDTLSSKPLEQLIGHDGATWLDRELTSDQPTELQRGFGAEVRKALDARVRWLAAQQLITIEGGAARFDTGLTDALEQRELRRTAAQLSGELGLKFAESKSGDRIEGKVTRALEIGEKRYALIEKTREFTLVPWRPVLERAIGKQVSGIARGDSTDWQIGRSRGLSIGSI